MPSSVSRCSWSMRRMRWSKFKRPPHQRGNRLLYTTIQPFWKKIQAHERPLSSHRFHLIDLAQVFQHRQFFATRYRLFPPSPLTSHCHNLSIISPSSAFYADQCLVYSSRIFSSFYRYQDGSPSLFSRRLVRRQSSGHGPFLRQFRSYHKFKSGLLSP